MPWRYCYIIIGYAINISRLVLLPHVNIGHCFRHWLATGRHWSLLHIDIVFSSRILPVNISSYVIATTLIYCI